MKRKEYPLDNSGIIHLANRDGAHTNAFRISVTLTGPVRLRMLQTALDHIAPRFPTIVAGIRRGARQYKVVPAKWAPAVQPDRECLAHMSEQMIERCAMRLLYSGRRVSVEIFHSLTDGYGGLAFLRALLKEYFLLLHGSAGGEGEREPPAWELADDYVTYGRGKGSPIRPRRIYRLPGRALPGEKIHVTTAVCDLAELRRAARNCQVGVTAFLTAALASAIVEVQEAGGGERLPVQLMVPADLRRRFESGTVRNFSLYALPCVEPEQFGLPFPALAAHMGRQIEAQLTKENLAGMMAGQVKLQNMPLVRDLPLSVKEAVLRLGNRLCETSCMTLSNLGEVEFPPELQPYVERVDAVLTPRQRGPYNCVVTSYRGKVYINFSRKCGNTELERRFFRKLKAQGCRARFETDGRPEEQIPGWADASYQVI